MKYIPRKHQQLAEEFCMAHPRAALLLDMGLGKTVITLTVLNRLKYEEVAKDTWSREQVKWDHLKHLRVVKIMGAKEKRLAALETDADIYVVNRENVEWLVETLGAKWDFDAVVIDELSSFKSAKAKRWKALRKVIFRSSYVYGLTGTPAPNGYMDLWPEIYLLDRGERTNTRRVSHCFLQSRRPPRTCRLRLAAQTRRAAENRRAALGHMPEHEQGRLARSAGAQL